MALVICLGTAGCANTPFDAAPYSPLADKNVVVQDPSPPPIPAAYALVYKSLGDAATNMDKLGAGYLRIANDSLRYEQYLDIPMYALGVAALGNGLFQGAKDATIALGLSTATMAGAKAYWALPGRAGAYFNGYYSLSCASGLASHLDNVQKANVLAPAINGLTKAIGDADAAIQDNATSADDKKTLTTLRDQARDSLKATMGALQTIATAPENLSTFARSVIVGTTKSAQSGAFSLDAAETAFKAAAPSLPTSAQVSSKVTSATLKAQADRAKSLDRNIAPADKPAIPSTAAIITELNVAITDAGGPTTDVTTTWSGLTACALPATTVSGK